MKNSNTLILINRNSKNNLEKLLRQLDKINSYDKKLKYILIVDNNSDDKSGKIIYENIVSNSYTKIILISNSANYGMGGSLKISFNYIFENIDSDNIILMHTSGRTDIFVLYKKFITKNKNNYKYILMSRYNKNSTLTNYKLIRNLCNKFYNFLVFIFSGKFIEDHGSGIFLIKRELLKTINFNKFTNDSFFNPQMNIVISKKVNIEYVPVSWGESNVKSHLNIYLYSLKLIFFFIKYFFLRDRSFSNDIDRFITNIEVKN